MLVILFLLNIIKRIYLLFNRNNVINYNLKFESLLLRLTIFVILIFEPSKFLIVFLILFNLRRANIR